MDVRTQNWLPPAGNEELCAMLQTLLLEIVVEDTEEELPHVTNKTKLYPLLRCSPFSAKWFGLNERPWNNKILEIPPQ